MARLNFDKLSLNLPAELPVTATAARKNTPPFEDHLRRAAEHAPRRLEPTPPREDRAAQSNPRSEQSAETRTSESHTTDDARAAADKARSDSSDQQQAHEADERPADQTAVAEAGAERHSHAAEQAAASEAAQRAASDAAADVARGEIEPTDVVSQVDADGAGTGGQHRAGRGGQPQGPAGARAGGTDGPSNAAASSPSNSATAAAAAAIEADAATTMSDQSTAASHHTRGENAGGDSPIRTAGDAAASGPHAADAANKQAAVTHGEPPQPEDAATVRPASTEAAATATAEATANSLPASGGRRERRSPAQPVDGAAQQPSTGRATPSAAAAVAADGAAAGAALEAPLDEAAVEPAAETLPASNTSGGSSDARPAASDAEPGEVQSPRVAGPLAERTAREAASDSADGLTSTQRMRLIQRVSRAMHTLSSDGGHLRLRLSPPELGALRIEVTVRGGALTARLEAETSAARDVLLDGLPQLRERLAEQGIRVEQFDVDLFEREADGRSQQAAGDGREGAPPRERGSRPAAARQSAIEAVDSVGAAAGVSSDGRLNVIV